MTGAFSDELASDEATPEGTSATEAVAANDVTGLAGPQPGAGMFGAAGVTATAWGPPVADDEWRMLSPRILIVRPLTDLARILPVLVALLFLHTVNGGGVIYSIVASAMAVVTGVLHWATTRYKITAERVYLQRGLFSRQSKSVARDRIRSVDVTAHPLHRMVGVRRVSIGTGRNDLRSGEGFHLDGLTAAEADALRVLLLPVPVPVAAPGQEAGAGVAPPAFDPGVPGPVAAGSAIRSGQSEIVALRLRWLRFAPLTMTGLVVLSVIVGTLLQVTNAAEVNPVETGPVRHLVASFAALPLTDRILIAAVASLIGYVLIATAGYVTVFWRFRLDRDGTDALRVTRGLLSTRATTISSARLRGVEISEPLSLRIARGARCIAITTGLRVGQGSEHEGSVLLPPAPRAVANSVTADVLGVPPDLCDGPLGRHGRRARARRYVRALAGAAAILAAVAVGVNLAGSPGWTWLALAVLAPAAAGLAADRYRSLGHRLAGGWLVARTGSLVRRRNILAVQAVIGWRIEQSWFQRRAGLVTLVATTAAGRQRYVVPDVMTGRALELATAATGDLVRPFLAQEARSSNA